MLFFFMAGNEDFGIGGASRYIPTRRDLFETQRRQELIDALGEPRKVKFLGDIYFLNGARLSDLNEGHAPFYDADQRVAEGYRIHIDSSPEQVDFVVNGSASSSHVFYRPCGEGIEAAVAELSDAGVACYEVGRK